jgi:CRP-like cAMP-binding protein
MAALPSHSVQKFPAGATIFKDGDSRQFLYIVQKGQIAIYKITATGERLPLGLIGSGEYLAETGLMDGKAIHATWAIALTDVDVIAIPSDLILEQLKAVPPWLVALTRGLSQKLRHMNELVRRNKLTDESLDTAMLAVQVNDKKHKV